MPSLSQPDAALESLKKGERLLAPIVTSQPTHREALRKLLINLNYQVQVIGHNRKDAEAAALLERTIQMFRRFGPAVKGDVNLMMLGASLSQMAQGLYINLERLSEAAATDATRLRCAAMLFAEPAGRTMKASWRAQCSITA